jgi:hypothetical protein
MSAITIQQMADRIAALMEQKLGARGAGLEAKVKARGRALPRKVRQAAEHLAKSAGLAQNPKLLLQMDREAVAESYDICLRYLGPLKARSRLMDHAVAVAASIAMSLLVVAAIVIATLRWRGLI